MKIVCMLVFAGLSTCLCAQSIWLGRDGFPKANPSPTQVGQGYQEVIGKPLRENPGQTTADFLLDYRMDTPWFLEEEVVELYKEEVSGAIVGALVGAAFGAPGQLILGGAALSALVAPEIGEGIGGLINMFIEWMQEALAIHDAFANPEKVIDDILGEALASADRQRAQRPGYGQDGENLLRNARQHANQFRNQLAQLNRRMRAEHQERMSADLLRATALVGTAVSGRDLTAALHDTPQATMPGGNRTPGGLITTSGTEAEYMEAYPDGKANDVRTSEGIHYGLPTREANHTVQVARQWAGDAYKNKVRIIKTYKPYPGMKTGFVSRRHAAEW